MSFWSESAQVLYRHAEILGGGRFMPCQKGTECSEAVCQCGVLLFLVPGADVAEGAPFAVAFSQKIRTALGVFLELERSRFELSAALQEQADRALRYFCDKGDLKWISLMLWAGANPRSLGPTLYKDYTDDPECFTTAIREATYSGNVEVLKKLKPDPSRDDVNDLLHCAALLGRSEALSYLLEIGAKPNDKPNGGSSALDRCLWELNYGRSFLYRSKSPKSRYEVSNGLECIRELASHGAIWNPDEHRGFTDLRRALYGCEPEVTIELLKIFKTHSACTHPLAVVPQGPQRVDTHGAKGRNRAGC